MKGKTEKSRMILHSFQVYMWNGWNNRHGLKIEPWRSEKWFCMGLAWCAAALLLGASEWVDKQVWPALLVSPSPIERRINMYIHCSISVQRSIGFECSMVLNQQAVRKWVFLSEVGGYQWSRDMTLKHFTVTNKESDSDETTTSRTIARDLNLNRSLELLSTAW